MLSPEVHHPSLTFDHLSKQLKYCPCKNTSSFHTVLHTSGCCYGLIYVCSPLKVACGRYNHILVVFAAQGLA